MSIDTFTFHHITSEGQDGDFTPSQQKSLIKLLPGLIGDEQIQPTAQLRDKIYNNIISNIEGDSLVWVPIRDLVNMKEPVTQAPINSSKVFSVLAGDDGLLKGNALIKPLLVGVVPNEDNSHAVLEGGRHRLSAVVSLFKFFGFSDEMIEELKLPCFVMKHNVKRIVADNVSRGATAYEKAGIHVTSLIDGIDLNNPMSIWASYKEGKFDGTPTSQRSKAMRLTFVAATENDDLDLTRETRGAIASALPTKIGHVNENLKYAVKDAGFLIDLMQFAASVLPQVVTDMKKAGVTNIARATADIAYKIAKMANEDIKKGGLKLPPKPERKIKETKAATVKEEKPKRVRTRKVEDNKGIEAVTV